MAVSCDPNDLQALAKCFQCLPNATLQQIQTYLLCLIANSGGTTGSCATTSAVISGTDIDWSAADLRFKTIVANVVFTFSNTTEARTISVYVSNTGAFTVGWPAGIKWTGAVVPTQTTGVHTDIYTFTMVNGIIYGTYVQNLT